MKINISQKEIGNRIAKLRKIKGISQKDLAKSIEISRPSLAQIEMGNRSIDVIELLKLSKILSFSLDEFMSNDFTSNLESILKIEEKPLKMVERISIPILKVNKLKNILLYILERCAGKPNIGETELYKLLYFSDFNYYELYEEQLTGTSYIKLPLGPVPQNLAHFIHQMIEKQLLQRVKTEYHGFPQTRYLPLEKADLTLLKASEKEVIDKVIEQMSDWSANMINQYSQGDKPWKATKEEEVINYELVFYRRPPYSVRVYEEDERN